MPKQRLEKDFSNILKEIEHIWWQKFYHVMGAYTTVPADYIVLTTNNNYLIECKECRNKSFIFSRLTQLSDLISFDSKGDNYISYILICFWQKTRKNSLYYLIDILEFKSFMQRINKKSANINDFKSTFSSINMDDLHKIFN